MCAIFGIIGAYDPARARQSAALLAHRGSDATVMIEEERFFWSHRRLAIVDTLHAPVLSHPSGVYLSFNGEIYNHAALRAQLSHYDFQTCGDTEVVLAAFLTWGEAFVEKLDGMYAIALYDGETLRLYRDSVGKKPLFYLQTDTGFYFASEIKALLPFCDGVHDDKALASYLSYQTVLGDTTFYRQIKSVEPAAMVTFASGPVGKRFFNPIRPFKSTVNDSAQAYDAVHAGLLDAVEKRLTHEVPMAFLLSGGVDSSLVVAMAKRLGVHTPVTYSLGYEEFARYDERSYAKTVATHLGSRHHEVVFTFDDFKASMDMVLWHLDMPINDPAALPLFHLFKTMKQDGIKVVLGGEGSDELFFGYRPHHELLEIEGLKKLGKTSWLKNYFNAHPSLHREWEWYRRVFNGEVLFRSSLESWSDRLIAELLHRKTAYKNWDFVAPFYERFAAYEIEDDPKWYRYIEIAFDQSSYFLTKLDRMSMAHTIEARTPFMDRALIDTTMRIESSLFFEGAQTKHLIKTIAQNYLPEEIIHRKKRGFSYPYIEWMGRMGAFEEMVLLNEKFKIFKPQALLRLIEGAKKGDFKQHVFGLYFYLRWLDRRKQLF